MAQDQGISLPGSFGGLVNYKEEYESKIKLKPAHVIAFIIVIVVVRIALSFIF